MRWTTWTFFVVAVALLIGVGAMVSRQSSVTPEQFLAAVEKRIADGRYDREQTLQNLDQVLVRAHEAGDADLETRVLLRRGRISMELGAWDRARTDLLAVAERRPDDAEVESDLIELETRAGDFAAAEARVRRGLEVDPESPLAWTRLGRLHRLSSERDEAAAVELLGRVLPTDDLADARAHLARTVALDPTDVARPGLAQRLRDVLRDSDEETLQQVLRLADRSAESALRARDAYARAVERAVEPEPLAALLELFARAGREDLTADLAAAAQRFENVHSDLRVARAHFSALESLGRPKFAAELARPWMSRGVPLDAPFLALVARLGLAADKPEIVAASSRELFGVGDVDEQMAGRFFHGLALVRVDQDQIGRTFLRAFVASNAPDPIPGARAMAWRAIAKASRKLEEPDFEREALQGAIELDPDHDGEIQLRIAELLMVAPHGGYRIPETRFAEGMRLLPARTEELLPRWHEIGQRELASIGFDPDAVRADLLRTRIWTPSPDATPYELYRLAGIHDAAGDGVRAKAHLQRLLDLVPGFVPALDLAIEVARKEPNRKWLLDLVAARVASGGRSPATTEILREIPLEELEPGDLRELMRADPEYFGRIAVARTLAAEGLPRSALALLESIDPAKFGDEARVLAARLQLDAGQPAKAWALLEPIGRELAGIPGAIEIGVRSTCYVGDTEAARGLLVVASLEKRIGRQRRIALADVALRNGIVGPARRLLEAIDSTPIARGGDLCVALAVAASLDGDEDATRRALARAEAFDTKGALERAALTIAIHAGRSSEWHVLADRAEARTAIADPLASAALLVLRERWDEARARIADALDQPGAVDARWALLARAIPFAPGEPVDERFGAVAARDIDAFVASFDAAGDPRAAAAWVAESALPEGIAFAAAELRERAGAPAALWPTWLRASLAFRWGDVAAAREGAETVATLAPDFRPAWDLREWLEPELRLDAAAYGKFRGERLQALGPAAGTPLENRQDRARALAARGDHAAAVAITVPKDVDAPASGELAAIAGRSLLALDRPREAVERLARALAAKPTPIDVRGTVADLLAAVDAASAAREPLPRAEAAEVLTRLAEVHGDDPRLVLALARIDLDFDERNPVLGVQRALSRLDRYRVNHRGRGLDTYEFGSAAAWIDFVARLDPARALRLADEELGLAPGSLPTWLAAARAHEAAGDRVTALADLMLAARIADRGEVSREILRLRSRAEIDPPEIVATVAAIQAAESLPVPDPALRIVAARGYYHSGPRMATQALELALAARGDPKATAGERRAASLVAALAILSRNGDEKIGQAAALLDGLEPERPSPLDADFLRALRGIARAAARAPAAQ